MVIKHSGQRVGVLIDVQNLYHSAKNLYNSRVNFREILKTSISGRSLIRVFAYVISTKTGEEKPFFEALTRLGIETRIKELQEFYGGQKKADCWEKTCLVETTVQQKAQMTAVSSAQKMVESSAQKSHSALPTVQASPASE